MKKTLFVLFMLISGSILAQTEVQPSIKVIDQNGKSHEFTVTTAPAEPETPQPLLIIDGIAQARAKTKSEFEKKINTIKPDDIKSINILKGEQTKIYGEHGEHGVIVVTTKKGVERRD